MCVCNATQVDPPHSHMRSWGYSLALGVGWGIRGRESERYVKSLGINPGITGSSRKTFSEEREKKNLMT